ncbi:MAG: polysaccharide deacetylase family protein [Acidobacteria bacterium]|nr:polysaccharide deacetylase family protein [Acidobacteriota bacterium]
MKNICFITILLSLLVSFSNISAKTLDINSQESKKTSSNKDSQNELKNELKTKLDRVIEAYRQIIVLFDDDSSLDSQKRNQNRNVAQIIYYEKQELLDELTKTLTSEIKNGGHKGPKYVHKLSDEFITYINSTNLHDADRLAFLDLADELLSAIETVPNKYAKRHPLYDSLEKLNKELKSIQDIYREELKRIFSQFGMRSQEVKREKWQDYVSFLKNTMNREQILKQYAQEDIKSDETLFRGGLHDTKNEIYGYDLPPKTILLTFDDGPHPKYTPQILETLKKYNAKAFFFHIGKNLGTVGEKNAVKLANTADISKKLLASGHLLANHSYSHPVLTKLSSDKREQEVAKTNSLLEEITGKKITFFRPPYGAKNADLIKEIEAKGMQTMMWNIDSVDWGDPIPESIVQRVLKELNESQKGILLMHDIHKQSATALPTILEELAKQDYTFLFLKDGKLAPYTLARTGETNPTSTENIDSAKPVFYRQNWAVVIGINDYKNWPKLRHCLNDANGVEEILTSKFNFKKGNIIKLLNSEATKDRIIKALDELTNTNKISKDDRVFFFFAGHGATRKLPSGKDIGYIIPVDSEVEASQAKAISMTQLQEFCELIPAKHLYFVIDSCYSGLALSRSGGLSPNTQNYLEQVTKRPARQILTAGGADQPVADNGPEGHSIFTWAFLQGLQGIADIDGNGVITASELGAYISPVVSSLSKQTPVFGNLLGSEGGEFVFELQSESLTEVSKQLDEEAIKLSQELDKIEKEIALKRERNIKLRQQLEEKRSKLNGDSAPDTRGSRSTTLAKSGANANTSSNSTPTSTPKTQSNKQLAQSHQTLGLKYYREKNYELAIKELQEAVNYDSKNATIANNLGYTYYKSGNYQEALKWLQKAMQLDPQRMLAYLNIADAYFKLGMNKEAKQNYEKALELNPSTSIGDYIKKQLELITQSK